MTFVPPRNIPAKAADALDVLGWISAALNFINLIIATIENIMGFGSA